MAGGLLQSDLDCMDLTEFDETEEPKRREALRKVANELLQRAKKMRGSEREVKGNDNDT